MCFAVTGLDIWASLLSTGIICTLYTTVVNGLWQLTRGAGQGEPQAGSTITAPWFLR